MGKICKLIEYGASPRGTIALDVLVPRPGCRVDFVSPEDVQSVIHDVLRHRLLISFEAEAEGLSADRILNELIHRVPVG